MTEKTESESKHKVLVASELFGVSMDFYDECMTAHEASDNMTDMLAKLRELARTPEERDYAMYFFGKVSSLNDFRRDPGKLLALLL